MYELPNKRLELKAHAQSASQKETFDKLRYEIVENQCDIFPKKNLLSLISRVFPQYFVQDCGWSGKGGNALQIESVVSFQWPTKTCIFFQGIESTIITRNSLLSDSYDHT